MKAIEQEYKEVVGSPLDWESICGNQLLVPVIDNRDSLEEGQRNCLILELPYDDFDKTKCLTYLKMLMPPIKEAVALFQQVKDFLKEEDIKFEFECSSETVSNIEYVRYKSSCRYQYQINILYANNAQSKLEGFINLCTDIIDQYERVERKIDLTLTYRGKVISQDQRDKINKELEECLQECIDWLD